MQLFIWIFGKISVTHAAKKLYKVLSADKISERNTEIPTKFMIWKLCAKAQFMQSFGQFGICAFQQNFHTKELGKIVVFYAANHVRW